MYGLIANNKYMYVHVEIIEIIDNYSKTRD